MRRLERMRKRAIALLAVALVLAGSGAAFASGHALAASELAEGSADILAGDATSLVAIESAGNARSARAVDVDGKEIPGSFYLYRRLLSGAELATYDAICDHLSRYENSMDLDGSVDVDQIQNLVSCVIMDHPEFFWVQMHFTYFYGIQNHKVYRIEFLSKLPEHYLGTAESLMEKNTRWILEKASDLSWGAERIKLAHDYLSHTVSYVVTDLDQTSYGAIVDKQGVCVAYSRAFQYIVQKLGIPCACVLGDAAGQRHMWNIFELEGEYYAMDVTWDDPPGNPENNYKYEYFSVTDDIMERDHRRDPFCELLPRANGTRYGYSWYGGSWGSDFSQYVPGWQQPDLPPSLPPQPTPARPVPTIEPTPVPSAEPFDPPPPTASATVAPTPAPTPAPSPELPMGVGLVDSKWLSLEGSAFSPALRGPYVAASEQEALKVSDAEGLFFLDRGMTMETVDASGRVMSGDEVLATGCAMRVRDRGSVIWEASVVIPGDVIGSGVAGVSQIVCAAKTLAGTNTLTGPYLEAANVTESGKFGVGDIVAMMRTISPR